MSRFFSLLLGSALIVACPEPTTTVLPTPDSFVGSDATTDTTADTTTQDIDVDTLFASGPHPYEDGKLDKGPTPANRPCSVTTTSSNEGVETTSFSVLGYDSLGRLHWSDKLLEDGTLDERQVFAYEGQSIYPKEVASLDADDVLSARTISTYGADGRITAQSTYRRSTGEFVRVAYRYDGDTWTVERRFPQSAGDGAVVWPEEPDSVETYVYDASANTITTTYASVPDIAVLTIQEPLTSPNGVLNNPLPLDLRPLSLVRTGQTALTSTFIYNSGGLLTEISTDYEDSSFTLFQTYAYDCP